jgi:ABC-type uncharacterized transport system auxiliary subunit
MTMIVLSVIGCTAPVVPQDRYYRIEVAPPASGTIMLNNSVEMDRFQAVGLTAGRALIYTTDTNGHVMQEYNYDFWYKPPSVMLRDALIGYLRNANVTNAIVTPEMRAEANYLLNGRILRFETHRGASPKAVVELELGVSDTRTGAVLIIRSYRTDVPAADGTVDAAVVAANKAVADIFARFLKDLRAR